MEASIEFMSRKLSKALRKMREEQTFGSGVMLGLLLGGIAVDALFFFAVLIIQFIVLIIWVFQIDKKLIEKLEEFSF